MLRNYRRDILFMNRTSTFFSFVVLKIRLYKTRSYLSSASAINFHKSVRFDRWCYFTARGGEIYIGEGTFLNTQVILNADLGGKIYISSNCIIGPRVIFRTANHNFENLNQSKRSQGHTKKDIHIGANVWIGANVTVLPGVSIGKNSVIGAGAVVTKNIPDNCLAVGVPAEIKKRLRKSD